MKYDWQLLWHFDYLSLTPRWQMSTSILHCFCYVSAMFLYSLLLFDLSHLLHQSDVTIISYQPCHCSCVTRAVLSQWPPLSTPDRFIDETLMKTPSARHWHLCLSLWLSYFLKGRHAVTCLPSGRPVSPNWKVSCNTHELSSFVAKNMPRNSSLGKKVSCLCTCNQNNLTIFV